MAVSKKKKKEDVPVSVGDPFLAKINPNDPFDRSIAETYRTLKINAEFFPWAPTPKQQVFLSMPFDEILYGGGSRSGKTVGMLMAAAQYVHVPQYKAIIFRRTFPDLEQQGGLIDLSKQWWTNTRARWNQQNKRWTFPSGASIAFGHMEHVDDRFKYQGGDFAFVGFEELCHFAEVQYTYLFSRRFRLEGLEVPTRTRATANPGGPGHEFVKKRFVKPGHPSRLYIPAVLDDNPFADKTNYLASLSQLDQLTRRQLEKGDWDAIAGAIFQREWFRYYDVKADYYRLGDGSGKFKTVKKDDCWRFAMMDCAGTEKTKSSADPDYTVLQIWDVTPSHDMILVEQWRDRCQIPQTEDMVCRTIRRFDAPWVGVEKNGLGLGIVQTLRMRGITVKAIHAKGSKESRAQTPSLRMSAGQIYFPLGRPWLDDLEGELVAFSPPDVGHDDQVDCVSHAAFVVHRAAGGLAKTPEEIAAAAKIEEDERLMTAQEIYESRMEKYNPETAGWVGAVDD